MPDAWPASWSGTPASAPIEIATNANGMPIPISSSPGSRSATYEPPGEICVKRAIPTTISAMPETMIGLMPTRVTSAAATLAQIIAVPAQARYATPVSIGE